MSATAERKAHPLFEAHRANQWTGDLPGLFERLMREARKKDDNAFAWRVLRGGAVVGIRVHPKHLRAELRIARSEPPETQEQSAKWEHEVGIFLKHFGITALDGETPAESEHDHWLELPDDPEDAGKAAARFLQLRKGEVSPGKALCHRCRLAGVAREREWFPGGGVEGQACMEHAFEMGAEYTRQVRQRLGLDPPQKTIDLMDALVKSLKERG